MKRNNLFTLMVFVLAALFFSGGGGMLAFSASRLSLGLPRDDLFGDYFLFSERRSVSLDLEEAALVSVLKMLSQQTGLNFISTEAVRDRRITAYLDQVPLKEAIEILFKANNLAYEYYPDAKMFVVKEMGMPEPELKSRVYNLQYARVGSSRMKTEIDSIIAGRGRGIDTGTQAGGQTGETERISIREAVEAVLTVQGRVVENSDNNSLIVIDSPSQFPIIEEVIKELDRAPIKVMIEVEVLDVAKEVVDRMGFRHDATMTGRGMGAGLFPYSSPRPISGMGSFSDGAIFQTDYRITAEFLKQDMTAKMLARPRILTLNNETAEVNVVSDEVVGLEIERDEHGVTVTAERVSDIGDYRGTGVSLRVTPQVNPITNEITMILHPSVVSTSDSEFETEWGTFKNIEDRSSRSVVRLNEGETLLLAGLIERKEGKDSTRVPFLSDVPFLGSFFRSRRSDTEDRELMIFLTPRIIRDRAPLAAEQAPGFLRREQKDLSRQRSIGNVLDSLVIR